MAVPSRRERSVRVQRPVRHRSVPRSIVLVLLAVLLTFGVRMGLDAVLKTPVPLVATSGSSMLPTIRTGELAVIQGIPKSSIHVGEIVAIAVPPGYQRTYGYHPIVLHRIYKMYRYHGQLRIITKGDHQAADPYWFTPGDIRGRLLYLVPYAGLPLLFLESRYGLIALGGIVLLLLLHWLAQAAIGVGIEVRKEVSWHPSGPATDLAPLVAAIHEYGQHLKSHTEIVKEMAGSAHELRESVAVHNLVLQELHALLHHPAQGVASPARAIPPSLDASTVRTQTGSVEGLPPRRQRRRARLQAAPAAAAASPTITTTAAPLPPRRSRQR